MMTSQDSYQKYQQPLQEANKCLHTKEMGHPFESNAGKVHPISVSKEQLKKTSSSGYFLKASKYAAVQADDYKKGSKKKGSFSFSKTCELINQISHNCTNCQAASNVSSHRTDNGLQKVSDTAHPLGMHLNGVTTQSTLSKADFGKCLDEFQNKLKEENFLPAIAKGKRKHKNHEKLNEGSLEMHSDNNVSIYNNTTNTTTIDALTLIPDLKSFKKSKSKCLESLNEHQSCSCSVDQHLQTTKQPSARRIVISPSSQISTEPELQKCRSLVSVAHCPFKQERCSSVDFNTPQANQALMSSHFNSNDIKSENSFSGWSRECKILPTTMDENSVCSFPQSQHSSYNQAKKKTSSNIQRIQQQLLRHQMENNVKKGSVFKAWESLAPEKQQDRESNGNENVRKKDLTYSERLQKEEKPYRQWHRMSRVVTAESKFIISPILPNHIGIHRCTNQNKFLTSQIEGSLQLEMGPLVPDKTTTSLASEEISELDIKAITCEIDPSEGYIPTSIPGPDMSPTGQPDGNKEMETLSVENDTTVNVPSISVIDKETEDNEKTQTEHHSKLLLSDPILGTISVHNSQADSKPNSNACSVINTHENVAGKEIFENHETSSESPSNKCPTLSGETSLPRYKSFIIKHVHKTRLNELSEASIPLDQSTGNDLKSKNTVDILKSLNSVSGVSEVMGPSFIVKKKNVLLEPSSKEKLKPGPKLRTAERSRNRMKSSAMLAGGLGIFLGSDMHTTFFKEPQGASKNMSRNSSMNYSRDSRILNSELEHPKVDRCQPQMCTNSNAGIGTAVVLNNECLEYSNSYWSSDIGVTGETMKDAVVTTAKMATHHKVFLADVASKLFHRVSRAGLRGPRVESTQKYTSVKATQDYRGSFPGQLSFRKGQRIKQRCFSSGPSDGMSYGYYRVGRLRKKRKGLFPSSYVTTNVTDAWDVSDKDSLTSSSHSAFY